MNALRKTGLLAVGLVAVALTGCGGGGTTVTGKVKYKDGPVAGLTIRFEGDGGKVATGQLDADGAYTVTGVPTGTVKVSFAYPPGARLSGPGGAAPPKPPKDTKPIEETGSAVKPTTIPPQYLNIETAKLSYDVTKGSNEIDIELK